MPRTAIDHHQSGGDPCVVDEDDSKQPLPSPSLLTATAIDDAYGGLHATVAAVRRSMPSITTTLVAIDRRCSIGIVGRRHVRLATEQPSPPPYVVDWFRFASATANRRHYHAGGPAMAVA